MDVPAGAKVSTFDDHPRWGDKSAWGAGPWVGEPDRVEWRIGGALHGLVCLAARGPSGSWCGYVGVPPGHPAHGKGYDAVHELRELDVHGGLTFAAPCDVGEHAVICHVPEPGEPDAVWWLGFDCAHAWDYSPGTQATLAKSARVAIARVERGEGDPTSPVTLDWLREQARPPQYQDPAPEDPLGYLLGGGTYRPFEYVRGEVQALALQLALMGRMGLLNVLSQRAAQLEAMPA